jgi:hypothetical protein
MTDIENGIESESDVAIKNAPKRGRGRPPVYSKQQWNHIRELHEKVGNLQEVHRILRYAATTEENQALLNQNMFPRGSKVPAYTYISSELSR